MLSCVVTGESGSLHLKVAGPSLEDKLSKARRSGAAEVIVAAGIAALGGVMT